MSELINALRDVRTNATNLAKAVRQGMDDFPEDMRADLTRHADNMRAAIQRSTQALRSTDPQCVVVKELEDWVKTLHLSFDQRAGMYAVIDRIKQHSPLRSEAEVKTEAARKERERLASILQRWAEDLNEPPGYGWRRKSVEWLRSQSSEGEG